MNREFISEKLSIIVPCYNVEDFIKECLDSLVDQTYRKIEVIMVDDGSPDNTGEILDSYDRKYENFKAVHTPNGGLSAARNAGLDYVSGEFLAFVDSDDVVPARAYEKLVGTLLQTGSDLASGFVNRFNSKKIYPSILHEKAIPETVLKTNINKSTNLVYDTTAWNKVYRSQLFLENNLEYPVGLTYEDIPVSMKYHLLAKSVDVIAEDTYHWRVREGANQSITQQRANFKLFWDRMQTLEMARKSINELGGSEELKQAFNHKVLDMDIPIYLNGFQNASEETLFEFQQDLVRFLRNYDLSEIDRLSIRKQVQYRALLDGDFKAFKRYGYQYRNIGKVLLEGERYVYSNNFLSKNLLQKISLENAIESTHKVDGITWKNDVIEIKGRWYIKQDAQFIKSDFKFNAEILNSANGKKAKVQADFSKKLKRHRIFWGKDYYYFTISFNVKNILTEIGGGHWSIDVSGTDHNLEIHDELGHPVKRGKSILPTKKIHITNESYFVTNNFNKAWKLCFDVTNENVSDNDLEETPWVGEFKLIHGHLIFNFQIKQKLSSPAFILSRNTEDNFESNLSLVKKSSAGDIYQVDFDLNNVEYGITKNYLKLINLSSEGSYHFGFSIDEYIQTLSEKELLIRINTNKRGSLELILVKAAAKMIDATLNSDILMVTYKLDSTFVEQGYKRADLLMVSTDGKESYHNFELQNVGGDTFTSKIPIADHEIPLFKKGYYNFFVDIALPHADVRVPVMCEEEFNEKVFTNQKKGQLNTKIQANKIGRLQVGFIQKWAWIDNSVRKRKLAYYVFYPLMRVLPIKQKTVIFESFWGRSFDDNPRAIYEYWEKAHPEYNFIWPVTDQSVQIDGKGKTIKRGSFQYWYYLATAKYLIQNTNFPNSYVKRNGQIEVETLHGTFMKKMGLEEPSMRKSSIKGQRNFMKRNRRWDYLISPSSYMDKIGAEAFDFKNKVLSVGFPRNDELINKNNADFINKIKNEIGLPLNKKVVLYAPTYRQVGKVDFEMDLKSMQSSLGDDYVVLVRLHHLVANAIDIHEFEGFAFDMSAYPNIADLYLISDVLITDYSSVMFDYGYLKRPMLFFAYDLDWYLDDTNRGVYLDYVNTVPGPIVNETDQIINHLENFDQLQKDYATKIETFYDKFCTYGRDGDASKTTVETIITSPISNRNGEKGFIKSKLAHALGVSSLSLGAINLLGRVFKRSNTIVFESNGGKNVNGDPYALYNYLLKTKTEYKLVWLSESNKAKLFEDKKLRHVVKGSFSGVLTMARAKYLITDSELPVNWKKPVGMKVIQTGKGSPIKKVGTDVTSDFIPGQTIYQYQKSQVVQGRKWDYLLAGNELMANIQKNAFRLNNSQIIMSGLPRTDMLGKMTISEITDIRKKLNIDSFSKVLLYEPTWRDDEIVYVDCYGMKSKIDFEQLSRRLPEDTVLLVKFHPTVTSGLPDISKYDNIVNVSEWNANEELLSVADLLITDYSSVMFDFALTNKPMIFMVPDLENYVNYVRGINVDDFESFVPGPIVKSTAELLNSIEGWISKDDVWEKFQRKTEQFNLKYNRWNDGNASQKALSYIFNRESYTAKTIDNPVEEIQLRDASLMWSDVYGIKNAKFIGNLNLSDKSNDKFKVLETRVLEDPINNTRVGDVFYKIRVKNREVWVSERTQK